ncbi:hypothetical protein LTR49_027658 [Elasticomyces elasticus]|nr:hypothetical protein LTR49_027658 [Elasticomyces elasticus]KAK5746744.1 hypothetical protein LTS12_022641 [Elasticomyces elasticus]
MQSTKRQNSHDQYWRLSAFAVASKNDLLPFVNKGGYTALAKTITKDTVLGYAFRIECEQLCYFRCSDAELKRFVKDRGLDTPEGRFRRSAIIEVLEHADEELAFTKFLDLPPELRTIIYDYYLAVFPEVLRNPVQPPSTRVCRLLRTETLPMFYQRTTFQVRLSHGQYRTSPRLHMVGDCADFVLSLAANDRSMVRKLELDIGPSGKSDDAKIVLASGRKAQDTRSLHDDSFKRTLENIKEAVGQAIRGMVEGKAAMTGFAMEDIYKLRAAIEKA